MVCFYRRSYSNSWRGRSRRAFTNESASVSREGQNGGSCRWKGRGLRRAGRAPSIYVPSGRREGKRSLLTPRVLPTSFTFEARSAIFSPSVNGFNKIPRSQSQNKASVIFIGRDEARRSRRIDAFPATTPSGRLARVSRAV